MLRGIFMQLIVLALVAALMGVKVDTSTILNAFMQPSEPPAESDVDAQIFELLGHITGANFAEVIKTAGILGEVMKGFSAPARKVFEAEEPPETGTKKPPYDGGVTPFDERLGSASSSTIKIHGGGVTPLAPIGNLADGEILHALSAALG